MEPFNLKHTCNILVGNPHNQIALVNDCLCMPFAHLAGIPTRRGDSDAPFWGNTGQNLYNVIMKVRYEDLQFVVSFFLFTLINKLFNQLG